MQANTMDLMAINGIGHVGVVGLTLFLSSAVIFILTPGIDTLFVLNKSLQDRRRVGVAAAIGVACGVLVHTVFATVGLAAIVATSARLFMAIKWLGAGYLIYLGVMTFIKAYRGEAQAMPVHSLPQTPVKALRAGLITNVLNPKVAIFFMAFFPQFIHPQFLGDMMPYAVLGGLYALLSVVWLMVLAFLAASFRGFLRSAQSRRVLETVSGFVFVALGVKLGLGD